jgi:hypothetical protein
MQATKSERQVPPLDLIWPLNRSVWLYGLRVPFTYMFLITMSIFSGLAPDFDPARYGIAILVFFIGLSGSHYLDVLQDREAFQASLGMKVPSLMLPAGLALVFVGLGIASYFAWFWQLPLIWLFGAICAAGACCYALEKPKAVHSPAGFAFFWVFVPGLGVFYLLTGTITVYALGVALFMSFFLGALLPVFQMHKTESGKKLGTAVLMAYTVGTTLGAIFLNISHVVGG